MQRLIPVVVLMLGACAGRTTPATQPAPASYDPSKNDAKALEVVAQMVETLGGADTWAAVKQITWDVEVTSDGKTIGIYSHAWDLWNARHRFVTTSMQSYEEAKQSGDPDDAKKTTVMYHLFERDHGTATYDKHRLNGADRRKATETAFTRWKFDAFLLSLPYRLTDPGAYVQLDGEEHRDECTEGCEIVKLTFDPSVGKDRYWIHVSKTTHRPRMVEIELDGKSGRMAYALSDWQEAGGLSFPGKADNIGARNMGNSEVITMSNIEIDDPDDSLYIPQIR